MVENQTGQLTLLVRAATSQEGRSKASTTAPTGRLSDTEQRNPASGGHSGGIKEYYVVRRNVQLACEAAERYYFGGMLSATHLFSDKSSRRTT